MASIENSLKYEAEVEPGKYGSSLRASSYVPTTTARDHNGRARRPRPAATARGGKYLTDCTLYVTVEPCVMCAGAIAWAQLGRLAYGAADEKRGFCRFAPNALHPKTQVERGVLEAECAALMQDFFRKKR